MGMEHEAASQVFQMKRSKSDAWRVTEAITEAAEAVTSIT